MTFRSHALAEFWDHYDGLPEAIQQQADKQYALFEADPNHRSLRFKAVGPLLGSSREPRVSCIGQAEGQ